MKRGALFVFTLIIFFITILHMQIVQANLGRESSQMTLDISIDSKLEAVETSSSARLSELQYKLVIFPKDTVQQTVLKQDILPKPESVDDEITFKWNSFDDLVFTTNVDSRVRVREYNPQIKTKVSFPLDKLDPSLDKYLVATENIDSDDQEIVELASRLASGQDDLTYVAFELFKWVDHNVQYNMSTITASASQPASWVLKNKYGVCDEITTLFMALSRSLGIPARYVSGVAYTNYHDMDGWQSHGWAELYFPEYGWVPFDVTYGEFGFVDPSHVVFGKNPDSNKSSSFIMWTGRDVQMSSNQLNIETTLISRSKAAEEELKFELKPLRHQVGFGSYNLIKVRVVNNKDYYVATRLLFTGSSGTKLISTPNKYVLVKPNSETNVYWTLKVDKNLKNNYLYEMPIGITSSRGTTVYSSFESSQHYTYYSLGEINHMIEELQQEDSLEYSKDVNFKCRTDNDQYYVYEKVSGFCNLKNTGNVILKNLKVCIGKCHSFDMGIGRSAQLNFTITPEKPGFIEQTIVAENTQITKTTNINYTILDRPKINIQKIKYPSNVSFDTNHKINIHLTKNSSSNPQDVQVVLIGGFKRKYNYNKFENNKELILEFNSKDLKPQNNTVEIMVLYYDKNNIEYYEEEKINIELKKLTVKQNIQRLWTKFKTILGINEKPKNK